MKISPARQSQDATPRRARRSAAPTRSVSPPQIQRKADTCACGGSCPRCQAKSKTPNVSRPGDHAERQADHMADRALSGSNVGATPATQTQGASTYGASSLETQLNGHGAPLDPATRSFFESRYQTNLADVQVHTSAAAASMAHSYEAHAFTIGRHIVFNNNEYAPHTSTGKRLIAHELAHVQQQRQMPSIARQVMRTAYAGCDKAKTGVDDAGQLIDDARMQAKRMIARARGKFPRLSGRSLLNIHRHFHCPENDQMFAIMKNLEAIEAALLTLPVQCISGRSATCKVTATTRGEAKNGSVDLCPAAFRDDARRYILAGTLINGAALTAGFTNSCSLADACYDDFTVPADVMLANAYSYTWFIIEQSGYNVAAPPTIPCSPTDTGENAVVPPSAATDATKIRPLSGFEDKPRGSVIQQIFSDRSGNRFIYSDTVAGAKAYTADGRKRVYLP